MLVRDVGILACPETRNPLTWHGTNLEGVLQDGVLVCEDTGVAWQVEEGWARLARDLRQDGRRARLLRLHDVAPRLHDPMLRVLLPALGSSTEGAHRNDAIERLDLNALHADVPRILEVGVGTGASLPLLARRLPTDSPVELWGVDVSVGMLRRAKLQVARHSGGPLASVRLLIAEATQLPFRDGVFDRVMHLGGLAGLASPSAALREMARVAVTGAPVVVVEASPSPGRAAGVLSGLAHKLLPLQADADLAELAPEGATDVQVDRLDPLFVALSFRAP